jgi:predicted lipoprotein with Yx(FWY)xxD motif
MLKKIATASIVLALVTAGGVAYASGMGTTVKLHSEGSLGTVLASSAGHTLYLYTPDGTGSPTCTGSCASTWPPLMTAGKPIAGKGVKKALLGTVKRGKKLQVKYNGHPLYRYTGDSKAGQANGEGADGIWFAIDASGAQK